MHGPLDFLFCGDDSAIHMATVKEPSLVTRHEGGPTLVADQLPVRGEKPLALSPDSLPAQLFFSRLVAVAVGDGAK